MIDIREEKIPPCKCQQSFISKIISLTLLSLFTFATVSKTLRVNKAALKFIKSASVFKEWVDDNTASLAKAYTHDMRYWKLEKVTDDYS